MSEIKSQRETASLKRAIAEFVALESNRSSLITVTNVELLNRGKIARVSLTVFPDHQEPAVLDFLNRKKRDIGDFLKKKIMIGFLPKVMFRIDQGQKSSESVFEIIRKETGK